MKFWWFLLIIQVLKFNAKFWNIRFGPRLQIREKETTIVIKHNNPILSSVKGFYGLIGPHVKIHNKTTLYELFTGDGIIQGAFFENKKITFMRRFIRTDKLLYEMENGVIPKNIFTHLFFMFFNQLKILPNMLGLANTAILNVNKKNLVLFERDMPYLLNIDCENKIISTFGKVDIDSISSFSAHSKFSNSGMIETLDYQVLKKRIYFSEINENMEIQKKITIPTKYLPIVHDFASTDQSIFICDSPIAIKIPLIFENKLPVYFDSSKKTMLYKISKNESFIEKYISDYAFYIFHYANVLEKKDSVEIFASIYENLDFNDLNIHGKYRKLILHKSNKTITMEQNPVLENMNLDFPIHYKDEIVLRNVVDNRINGFVICKDLSIMKKIEFADRSICGEPALVQNSPFLIFFATDIKNENSFIILLDLNTYKKTELSLGSQSATLGFHSLFIENK